jgi:hypothetical protein
MPAMWSSPGLALRSAIFVALLATPAIAEDPPQLTDEAKEALRQRLLATFAALPIINHSMTCTGTKPGEPEVNIQFDLWREGSWASFGVRVPEGAGLAGKFEICTDGEVLAIRTPDHSWIRVSEGLDRLAERERPHDRALGELQERWGVAREPTPSEAGQIRFNLKVRPEAGEFKLGFSMKLATSSEEEAEWLAEDYWKACTVALDTASGTVQLREGPVECTLRVKDALPLRWEAHDAPAGRHVYMSTDAPRATAKAHRERVREVCASLHGERHAPSPLGLFLDAANRLIRMQSIAKAKVALEREAEALAAWADLLVRTEAELLAQDAWETDPATEHREKVRTALLAGIDALKLKPDWGEERASRFAALLSARWAEVMEPKAVKSGDAR